VVKLPSSAPAWTRKAIVETLRIRPWSAAHAGSEARLRKVCLCSATLRD